ncbi:MAG: PAS domain S-box protein [Myxococcales bacterium]|nr:PAS domain S-box protein [Myxococcales bacterium]
MAEWRVAKNEVERLQTLASLEVLDTPYEPEFDRLTALAREWLDVPVALVVLIDATRQWFKSGECFGVRETSRAWSICNEVVVEGEAMVIDNTLEDPRFMSSPLVQRDPGIRFYAGHPLRMADGTVLGSFCLIDHAPRSLDARGRKMLETLALQTVELLAMRLSTVRLAQKSLTLMDREARLRAVLDGVSDAVLVQDLAGRVIEANAAAEERLGLSLDALDAAHGGARRWPLVDEQGLRVRHESLASFEAARAGHAAQGVRVSVERPDGSVAWFQVNAHPLRRQGESQPYGVVSTFRDITVERATRAATERMARQERLLTTGTLAAGIGHEINNPLTFVYSNVELALEALREGEAPRPEADALTEMLTDALDGAERIRKIVRGLRALARDDSEPTPTSLEAAVGAAVQMAMHELRPRARVVVEGTAGLMVLADETRLAQILVNLLVNAGQCFVTPSPAYNLVRVGYGRLASGEVFVSVSDNGPGIGKQQISRIFDPFYTTKGARQGTGLGLPISQNLAHQLGGEITVESALGEGARFIVRLPGVARSSGSQRALVLDADPGSHSALVRALSERFVVEVATPAELLRRVELGESWAVIFCDLAASTAPRPAVYELVRRLRPALARRFVFLKPPTADAGATAFLATVTNELLETPPSVEAVWAAVARVVAASEDSSLRAHG